jgi:hypothetical protein
MLAGCTFVNEMIKHLKTIKIMKNLKIPEASLIRSDFFTVLISMLAAALVLLPLFTSASNSNKPESGEVYMHPMEGSRAAVSFTNLSERKYTISIESSNGLDVFYSESINSPETFAKVFDFSHLADGDYTLNVQAGNSTKEKHFEIKNGAVNVKSGKLTVPTFKYQGTKAFIDVPNTENQLVSIKLFSPQGEELYSDVEKHDVSKLFDFGKVDNGKYTLLVTLDDASYQYNYIKQ